MKKLEFFDIEACDEAAEWSNGKTWQEVYTTCHRGDWLLWLFARTNPDDLKTLTLTKGHCANTVRHLMKDERSVAAVDAAIDFGEGKISIEKLNAAATAACAAYAAGAGAYTAAAAAAAGAGAYIGAAAAAGAAYAASYAADAAAATSAKKENQQQTADIARKYLPIEIWNIKQSKTK